MKKDICDYRYDAKKVFIRPNMGIFYLLDDDTTMFQPYPKKGEEHKPIKIHFEELVTNWSKDYE